MYKCRMLIGETEERKEELMGRWARSLGQNQIEVQYGLGSYFLIPDTRRQRGGRKKEENEEG